MIYKAHNYQRYCIERIISQKEIGLFLDMGLGKTVITLTALNDLFYNRFEISKALVIAPKKVAEGTWALEADKWDHLKHLRISTCLGSSAKRIRALCTPADIYVINRENVSWLVDYYKNDWPFDTVVIDELSSFKSRETKRFKDLKAIRPRIDRIIGLTGTPAPNGLMDLWAQVYLLDKGQRLYKTITQYRNRYFDSYTADASGRQNYTPKDGAKELISKELSDLCISMQASDYLELPDLVVNPVYVVLDAKADKAYREFETEYILQIPDGEISATNGAALSNKLLQLCNGAVYDEDRGVHRIHDCKMDALKEIIESLKGHNILLFYSFQHDKERIMKEFPQCRELKTVQDQKDWNDGKIELLLAHPVSAAYGLNLQDGGNHMIWFGLNWSLELYQQALKRLHRQGQKQKVIVHQLLVKGKRDEDVAKALEGKSDTQQALLDSLKARIQEVKERLKK